MRTISKWKLFSNWHAMRWVALTIGAFFATLAIMDQEVITGMLAAFFLFQALTNKGCMVSPYCAMPADYTESNKEPEYTEVK